MTDFEEGDTVYMPDGTKGEVIGLSHNAACRVNGVHVSYSGGDGLGHFWFDPELLHRLSFDQRLRRIERRLGLDD